MLKTKKFILSIVMVFLLHTVVGANNETMEPRYQLETGRVFKYNLSVNTVTTQKVVDQTIIRHQNWEIGCSFKVTGEKTDQGFPVEATFDSIKATLENPFFRYQGNLSADNSDLPGNLRTYSSLVGKSISFNISNRVFWTPDSFKLMNDKPTKNPLDLFRGFDSQTMIVKQLFPQILTNNIFVAYPDSGTPLQSNDTWEQTIAYGDGNVTPRMDVVYTVKEINDKSIILTAKTKSDCVLDTKQTFTFNDLKMVVAPDLTGTMEGTIRVDKQTGLPLTGKYQLSLTGNVTRLSEKIPTTYNLTIEFNSL